MTFVSRSCQGETCRCGVSAKHKVEETIFPDDPEQVRHPYTAYVCESCFEKIMHGQIGPRYGLAEAERNAVDEGLTFLEERDYPLAALLLKRIVERACSSFRPDWASPPGASIAEYIEEGVCDEADLCRILGLHPAALPLLLKGQLTIDDRMAEALAIIRGTKTFWVNRERLYRAALHRLDTEPVEAAERRLRLLREMKAYEPTVWGSDGEKHLWERLREEIR